MGSFFLHTLEQCFLFFPLILGLFLSFQLMKISDITADGSFVLGAALFAKCILLWHSPILALFVAIVGSGLVGVANSVLQAQGRIHPLMAGIFLLFILHSLTLIFMGRPNISLLEEPTLFSQVTMALLPKFPRLGQVLVLTILNALLLVMMMLLAKSHIGLLLRAYGDQPPLLQKIGRNPHFYRTLGLSISSALAGFSGALSAQSFGYADLSMGVGQALIGIAVLLLGVRFLLRSSSHQASLQILGILLATILYFSAISFLVWLGCNPLYLRAILGMGLCLLFIRRDTGQRYPFAQTVLLWLRSHLPACGTLHRFARGPHAFWAWGGPSRPTASEPPLSSISTKEFE